MKHPIAADCGIRLRERLNAMSSILIVDDESICRETLAKLLELSGFRTLSAAHGKEALALVHAEKPDLIILDIVMPQMDGMSFLRILRRTPKTAQLPVILLTGLVERNTIVNCAELGVRDCLLKAQFSLQDLMARIRKYVGPGSGASAAPTAVTGPGTAPIATGSPATTATGARGKSASPARHASDANGHADRAARVESAPRPSTNTARLTRESVTEQIQIYAQSKTLAGVVAEVIQMTSNPRTSMGDLVGVLKQDPLLASRVLQVANTAAFATKQVRIATLEDAVRNIGQSAIRNIASTVGIFDAFPSDAADGFNLIRCWQHSFAVAAIMDQLTANHPQVDPGTGHLVGLCHDLAEIVFRQCFAEHYAQVLEQAKQGGQPLQDVEEAVFGIEHHSVVRLILGKLSLPESITAPICEYFDRTRRGIPEKLSPLAQALRAADLYAHGLMLASSPQAALAPLAKVELNAVIDTAPTIDDAELRCDILSSTSLLARLSPADERKLSQPLFSQSNTRIWYARHATIASFDPVAALLNAIGALQVKNRLPTPDEASAVDAVVIASSPSNPTPFAFDRLAECQKALSANECHVIHLIPPDVQVSQPVEDVLYTRYPLSIAQLVQTLMGQETDAVPQETGAHTV